MSHWTDDLPQADDLTPEDWHRFYQRPVQVPAELLNALLVATENWLDDIPPNLNDWEAPVIQTRDILKAEFSKSRPDYSDPKYSQPGPQRFFKS